MEDGTDSVRQIDSPESLALAVNRSSDVGRILLLHPAIRWRCAQWLRVCREELNLKCFITWTLRTMQEQDELYALGRTTPGSIVTHARAGQSWHNFALAFDFCLVQPDGKRVTWDVGTDYNADGQVDWQQLGEAGERLGMEWGMRWPKGKTDGDHFEYHPGLILTRASEIAGLTGKIPQDYFDLTRTA